MFSRRVEGHILNTERQHSTTLHRYRMRYSSIRIISIVCFILFCFLFGLQTVQSYCMQNGKSYSIGDVWSVNSRRQCRKCKCLQGRHIRCLPNCNRNLRFPLRPLLPHDLSKSTIQPAPTGTHCILEGKRHNKGESWTENSQHSRNLDRNQCMECNCKAQVTICAIRRCPVLDCHNPVTQPGTCCKTCQERPARPPRESSKRGCLSIGGHFQDEEVWQLYLPSPDVVATCVDCNCKNARDRCSIHPCPITRCLEPVKRPGDCCALCPGQRPSSKKNKENYGTKSSVGSGILGFLLKSSNQPDEKGLKIEKESNSTVDWAAETTKSPNGLVPNKKKEIGCRFGANLYYRHKEIFYPVLNKKVQICTKCVCMNTIVNCARIRCPTRYPCRRPFRKDGFCCKVCEAMSDREARNLEAIQMYQNMGCSRAKRNQLQVYRYNELHASATQLSARYLFDKSHQPNNKRSEIHHLQFVNLKVNVTKTYLENDDVTRNSLDKNWNYLGAIKEKMFSRFKRLEDDLLKCRDARRCIKKLTNLIDHLKTKAARRKRCETSQPVRAFGRLQK